jgi:hypothetical protein
LSQVGGFHIFHVEDLRAIAPLWLDYTKKVRAFAAAEPELFFVESMKQEASEEGVRAVRQKQAKWHSEMYGYVFGAAVVGVTHHMRRDVMLYPGYQVRWRDGGCERLADVRAGMWRRGQFGGDGRVSSAGRREGAWSNWPRPPAQP